MKLTSIKKEEKGNFTVIALSMKFLLLNWGKLGKYRRCKDNFFGVRKISESDIQIRATSA